MNLALMIPLAERTAVLVVAALLFTRVKAFRSLLNQRATYKDKAVMVLIFSGISILGTYNGIWYQDAIANSRVIGTIVAGLLAGPWVGLATGLVAGIHRYTLGGFTDLACAISTISEGVLAGLFTGSGGRGKFAGRRQWPSDSSQSGCRWRSFCWWPGRMRMPWHW
ncbi:hypothetical protein BBOR36S_01348 [Brevibacillus borstelensis]